VSVAGKTTLGQLVVLYGFADLMVTNDSGPAHFATLTPMDVVTGLRMRHAGAELRLSARPILEIAIDCGYESLSHFYAMFRRIYGTSPRTYRMRNRMALQSER